MNVTLPLLLPILMAQTVGAAPFSLTSPAFEAGGQIPRRCTCEGDDRSPALAWTAPPPGTKSLVLIVEDPDAPDPAAPQRIFVHWVLYNLPPAAGSLPEAVSADALPAGTRQGRSDFGRTGYRGPCPPIGRHRYFFRLSALDIELPDLGAATKAQLTAAMQGHVLATAELMGTYQKGDQ